MYVNQVGGQDEIVFDGSSFIADAHKVLRRLPACESATDLVTFDKDKKEFSFSEKIFEEKVNKKFYIQT